MLTSSAKAKGRRACQRLRDKLLETFTELQPKDIRVTPSGVTGEDLLLSPKAEQIFPYVVEVKCQEKLNIWKALEQAKSHDKSGLCPLLAFTRNREKMFICLELRDFLRIVNEHS